MASYLPFEPIDDAKLKTELKEEFLNDPNNKKLSTLLKNSQFKKGIAVNIHKCSIEGAYIIMVKGQNDGLLIKLGKGYGFPRGFPIFWVPNVITRYFGFLPKFSNDDRQYLGKSLIFHC